MDAQDIPYVLGIHTGSPFVERTSVNKGKTRTDGDKSKDNLVFLAAMFPLVVAVVAVVFNDSRVTWAVIALGTVGLLALLRTQLRSRS